MFIDCTEQDQEWQKANSCACLVGPRSVNYFDSLNVKSIHPPPLTNVKHLTFELTLTFYLTLSLSSKKWIHTGGGSFDYGSEAIAEAAVNVKPYIRAIME